MGSGIAQAFAQTEGYEVALCDINEEFAANGKKKIAKGFEKRIAKGKMTQEDADKILAKITTGVKDICGDCDLVIEAAIENMEIKKQTFKELDAICRADCIFATNTSPLHHRDWSRRKTGCGHAFLQSGSSYEAGRGHCRTQHSEGDGR